VETIRPAVQIAAVKDSRRDPASDLIAAALLVVVGGYLAWMLLSWGGDRLTRAVDDLGQLLAAAVGSGLCLWAARVAGGDRRRGWLLLGLAALSWALGELVWSYLEVLRGQLSPFPSPADAGFLLAVPLTVGGVLQFFRGNGLASARVGLDGAIVAAALFFISWVLVLEPTIGAGGVGGFNLYLGLAYPIGDIITLVIVIAAVARSRAFESPLAYVAAGVVAIAISDSFFLYLTTHGAYSTNPADTGWFAGFLLIGFGAIRSARSRAVEWPAATAASARVLLPYIPLLGALALAGAIFFRGGALGRVGAATLFLLVGLVLLRQVIVVREVGRLSAELAETVAKLRAREQDLSYQTLHDPLTQLANRVLFRDRLEHALDVGRREAQSLAIVFLDLDDFKVVNDNLGHDAGDRLLVAAAERIRACVRPGDTVARLGGDEFAVILVGAADPDDVLGAVKRLHDAFGTVFMLEQDFLVGISIGVVVATNSSVPAADLLRRADVAMYAAKAAGKNRHAFYDDSMMLAFGTAAPAS